MATVKARPGQHLSSTVHLFSSIWPAVCVWVAIKINCSESACESRSLFFPLALSRPLSLSPPRLPPPSTASTPSSPLWLWSQCQVVKTEKTQERHICHPIPAALGSEYAERQYRGCSELQRLISPDLCCDWQPSILNSSILILDAEWKQTMNSIEKTNRMKSDYLALC